MEARVCYHCDQIGHIKTECPSLRTGGGGGVLRTPTTAPLRITDGRVGQAGIEGTRGGIYQLIGDEAQAAP